MVLDSRIAAIRDHYNIQTLEDWRLIPPHWVLDVDGVGPRTLGHLRFYLATKGCTLYGDQTPEFWLNFRADEAGVQQIAGEDRIYRCPFTVVVDSNETLAYAFRRIHTDNGRPLRVETIRKPLYQIHRRQVGGFLVGMADYSIDGLEDKIQIERKTASELYGDLGAGRERFEARIQNLDATCEIAYLLVEATWEEILASQPRQSQVPPKVISRTHDSWSQKYPRVHWVTCDSRDLAEAKAFRLLEMYWRRQAPAVPDFMRLG